MTRKELVAEIDGLNKKLNRFTSQTRHAAKYDDVILLLDSIIWERNVNNLQFTSVSPQAQKHLGYPVKEWMNDPAFWQSHIHEDDRDKIITSLQKAIDDKKDTILDYRMITDNGEVIWLRDKISISVRNDKISKLYGIITNITTQKETESKLISSQENLELFFAQSLDGFFIMMLDEPIYWDDTVDKEKILDFVFSHCRITRFNNAILQIFGMTSDNFSGIDLNNFFAGAIEDKRQEWRMFYDSGHLHIESKEYKFDGTEIWVEGDYICLYDDKGRIKGHFGIQRDVTDRKKALEKLRMTQFAIENANIGVYQVDDDGCIHYANEYACQSLGYSLKELLDLSIVEIDTKFDLASWKKQREIIRAGGMDTVETVFRRKDGSNFPVEVTIDFVEYKGKNLSYSFVKDITDRKEADKKLKENKERLELALKGTGAGLWDWDLKTDEIIVSNRLAEILGYNLDELQPKTIQTWMKLLYPDDLKASEKILKKHLAGELEYFEHESRVRHKSGQWIWIFTKGKISELNSDGTPVRMTGSNLDITRRRQAEDKIRESEEKYRSLLNNQNDAVLLNKIKPEGFSNFTEVNDIACERYGYTREEFIKLSPPDITINEDAVVHARANHHEKLLTEGHIIFETQHITKSGKYFPVEISSNVIEIKGEKFILAVVRDITDRKQLQGQLQQAQKMEAIGQLAGGVAHDFNNLLTIINGYCELLLFRELPGDIKGLVKEIQAAGMRASRLTSQLLAFSRKQIIQPKVVNLNVLITDQMKMLGRLLGEDIEISTLLDPTLGNTKADPGQLEQVIMNIVINARDAMPFGGKLTIETNNKKFDKEFINTHLGSIQGDYVALSISDNGVGMDKGTVNRIFEPFFTTKGRDKGTGLGLATVYGILKQNNGFIYVYSEPQKGTTFKIYLPLIKEALQETNEGTDERDILKGKETILLAEDDEGVRKVTHSTLASYGYKVLLASNGEEAVRIFNSNKDSIDLLLTDVIMPLMSGRELADKLLKEKPSLKVLYFSGYTDDSIVQHGVLDEGMEFLQKPYTHVELAKKVKSILSQ